MATTRKLYWGSGSPFAWRAMIALDEKALASEAVQLSFMKRENKSEEYLKINPRGQIPSFVDGDIIISESAAICEYLEAAYPTSGTKLLPDDLKLQAQVYQYMWEENNIYPLLLPHLFAAEPPSKEVITAIRTEFGRLGQAPGGEVLPGWGDIHSG